MVGDWVDESESVKAHSNVRWADNNSFLIRTYQVDVKGEKATSGTVFVGWDPQTGQIKSWLFDSNGGHGEGLWTRTGEKEWVVKRTACSKTAGRLRQPRSTWYSTRIRSRPARLTGSSEGRFAPDISDVVMVRRPPQPGGAPSQPTTAPGQPGTRKSAQ